VGCLDYIMIEPSEMEVVSFGQLPDEELVTVDKALPSQVFPSDHISILADLRITKRH